MKNTIESTLYDCIEFLDKSSNAVVALKTVELQSILSNEAFDIKNIKMISAELSHNMEVSVNAIKPKAIDLSKFIDEKAFSKVSLPFAKLTKFLGIFSSKVTIYRFDIDVELCTRLISILIKETDTLMEYYKSKRNSIKAYAEVRELFNKNIVPKLRECVEIISTALESVVKIKIEKEEATVAYNNSLERVQSIDKLFPAIIRSFRSSANNFNQIYQEDAEAVRYGERDTSCNLALGSIESSLRAIYSYIDAVLYLHFLSVKNVEACKKAM